MSLFSGLRGALAHLNRPDEVKSEGPGERPKEVFFTQETSEEPGPDLDSWTLLDWAPLLTESGSYGRLAKLTGSSQDEVRRWFRSRDLNPVEERERILALLASNRDLTVLTLTEDQIEDAIGSTDSLEATLSLTGLTRQEVSAYLSKRGRSIATEWES